MSNRVWAIATLGFLAMGFSDLQNNISDLIPSSAIAEAAEPLETSDTYRASNAAIAELKIGYDTRSLDGVVLSRGPVDVAVSYTAREDITAENRPLLSYEISYNGEVILTDSALAVGYGRVLIGDLDQDGASEVVIQGFTGGANCCVGSVVYSWRGSSFKEISLGDIGGDFEDIDGDGSFELVTKDQSFLYVFSGRPGSVLPPQIFRLQGDEFVEATRDYPGYVRATIAEMEAEFGDRSIISHGQLAAYVANKALAGEYESAWKYMLSHYQGEPAQGSAMVIRDEAGNIIGQYKDFPTALKALLEREGYR